MSFAVRPRNRRTAKPSNRQAAKPSNRETVSPFRRKTAKPSNRIAVSPSGRQTAKPFRRFAAKPSNRPVVRSRNRIAAKPRNRQTVSPLRRETVKPQNRVTGFAHLFFLSPSGAGQGGEKRCDRFLGGVRRAQKNALEHEFQGVCCRMPAMTDFRTKGTIIGPMGLTAVFGMGTGVTPSVWSPTKRQAAMFRTAWRVFGGL